MPDFPESTAPQVQSAEILEELRETRSTLLLGVPASDAVYTSLLLEIGPDHLHIDQLMPQAGDQLLQRDMPLRIRTSHGGLSYWFTSLYLKTATDRQGLPYHAISRPSLIESADKRSSFRIPVRRLESPDCRISFAPGQTSQSRLEDISEGGACVRMIRDPGSQIIGRAASVRIEFGPGAALQCSAQICYLQPVPRSNQVRVGLSFRGLPFQEVRNLRRILMRLQRRNIKTGFVS